MLYINSCIDKEIRKKSELQMGSSVNYSEALQLSRGYSGGK